MSEQLDKLTSLGLTNRQIAGMCNVENPETVSAWRNRGRSPGKVTSKNALHRLGKVIDHLKVDLEQDNETIMTFLAEEPTRVKPYDVDERWTEERARADRTPLANHIGGRYGLVMVAGRILERFPEAKAEGNYTQPQTYVYHLVDMSPLSKDAKDI